MSKASDILDNVSKVIVGKRNVSELVLTSIIAGGHVLLEDVPGTGKTMMAKSFAKSIDGEFSRIQFTPDLLPSDITGVHVYNQKEGEFVFRRGPVFAMLFLLMRLTEQHRELSRHFLSVWKNIRLLLMENILNWQNLL